MSGTAKPVPQDLLLALETDQGARELLDQAITGLRSGWPTSTPDENREAVKRALALCGHAAAHLYNAPDIRTYSPSVLPLELLNYVYSQIDPTGSLSRKLAPFLPEQAKKGDEPQP